MKQKNKGQAAIEFLTTYGWALMIIMLTIGALTYFDLFNVTRFISEKCETGAQISCLEVMLTETGNFSIRLANNHPVPIYISSISVYRDEEALDVSSTYGGSVYGGMVNPGDIHQRNFNLNDDFSRNTRESFEIVIRFSRAGGTKNYFVNGNIVVRPIPESLLESGV